MGGGGGGGGGGRGGGGGGVFGVGVGGGHRNFTRRKSGSVPPPRQKESEWSLRYMSWLSGTFFTLSQHDKPPSTFLTFQDTPTFDLHIKDFSSFDTLHLQFVFLPYDFA